jgi:hypothetical protein
MGPEGVAAAIKRRVGNGPCYLSFDIDTIDPSMAPASESSGGSEVKVECNGMERSGADESELSLRPSEAPFHIPFSEV